MGNILLETSPNSTPLPLDKITLIQRTWRNHFKSKVLSPFEFLPENSNFTFVEICEFDEESLLSPLALSIQKKIDKFPINTSINLHNLSYKQIIYRDNSIYFGYFNLQTMQREGIGTLYTADHNKYYGEFSKDTPNGIGWLIFNDGSHYQGMFSNGKMHGYGKLEMDKYTYIGNWENNEKSGYGEEQYEDGLVFKGNFYCDEKNGHGKLSYPNGKTIEGFFTKEEEISGICRMRTNEEDIISLGEWKKGKMNGINLVVWNRRKRFIGQYKNNIKNGFGVFLWEDEYIYEGNWINGKQMGYARIREIDRDAINERGKIKFNYAIKEYRYGIEINTITELNWKYIGIKEEIEKNVEMLDGYCRNNFDINGIIDSDFANKIINFNLSNIYSEY